MSLPRRTICRAWGPAGLSAIIVVAFAGCAQPTPSPTGTSTPTQASATSPSRGVSPSARPLTFSVTGSMAQARDSHTATLLRDGRVLIAGGESGFKGLASAELYDPTTGKFNATGSLTQGRMLATATLLLDGRVLIAGGIRAILTDGCDGLTSAELYDPATGKFTPTGSLAVGRQSHTATLLRDGRVLIAGGCYGYPAPSSLSSAETYDPATGKFSEVGPLTAERFNHSATLLTSGRVLVAGGRGNRGEQLDSAELFDPTTNTFNAAGSMPAPRSGHSATGLADGRVLLMGGIYADTSADLYDPATGAFSRTGATAQPHQYGTVSALRDGRALVVGGWSTVGAVDLAEVYDPATGHFSPAGTLAQARWVHTATLLADGRVLLVGGRGDAGSAVTSAELCQP
jgi:hypothetical protein